MKLTKRAILYVGYKCNIKCRMCYYRMTPDMSWKEIECCKKEVDLFKDFYEDTFVDITGGEPTIYPEIFELIEYCVKQKIQPTIITNGICLVKRDYIIRLKDAGINDVLVSVHALDDTYNWITQTSNGSEIQKKALDNINSLDIPWRANIVVIRQNIFQLKDIAKYLIEQNCKTANYIIFNPFHEWAEETNIDFQAKHSEISESLISAIDLLESRNIRANVRYLPLCMLPGYEKNIYGFSQLSYDEHEWDFFSWYKLDNKHINDICSTALDYKIDFSDNYDDITKFMCAIQLRSALYSKPIKCSECSANLICDGLSLQYAKRYGDNELNPFFGEKITDPRHFILKH